MREGSSDGSDDRHRPAQGVAHGGGPADNEEPLGELRVRSAAGQVERLVQWATVFTERTGAIEGAGGLGYLLAQQLVAAGERVLDLQPKLAARLRLLATGASNKNDPNDARSVAVAELRSTVPEVRAEDHVKVMKVWAKRHRDLSSHRTRIACRLHAVLCELTPGGFAGEISAAQATRLLDSDPRSPRHHRGLAHGLQRATTPHRPRRPHPHRVRPGLDHQATRSRIAPGPLNGSPSGWRRRLTAGRS